MSGISERNPFVGPRPIEQGEPLHGRDVEVRELYNRLQARRIVVLHSPSGAGKSSLVQAGLIPRLAEGGYDVWKPIRVNLDPGDLEGIPEGTNRYLLSAMISLEEELPELNRRTPGALARLEFIEYLEKRPRRKGRGGQPVVLIFDQFEEVLTVAALAVEAKRAFFTAVGQALESEKFWALFLIREDHLAAFAPYRDRIPTQMSNTFRLDLLGLAGAREAAQSLAAQGGRSFPAVDQLVHDLSRVQVQQADGSFVGEQGLYVEPVQLQVVCRRLWDAMPEDDLSIDPEDIAAYASVSEALGGYYADTVRAIAGGDDAVERSLRDWVGHKLIVGGIRSQLRQEVGKTAGLDNRLIARLLDSYLVRTEPRAGAHWFELSHDRLVEPVQKNDEAWDQAHLHPLQVQAKLWEDARRSAGLLLGAGALPGAQAWAREHPALLTAGEREFLELSRALRASEQAARRRLIALAVVAGLVAVGVGVLGVVAWGARGAALAAESKAQAEARRAEEATQRAEKARVRAENASLLAGARELAARGQPDLATRLLLAADRPEEVRGWSELTREILGRPMLQTELRGHEGEVTSATWSPDGRRVLTVADDGAAWIWMADGTGEPVVLEREGQGVSAAAWSPDGSQLVIATEDNAARVVRADGSGEPVVLAGHTDIVASLVWSPTGERIVTVLEDGDAWVWRADGTGQPVVLADEAEPVGAAVWSPDGRRIVTVFGDMARVWDADGAGVPVVLKGHEDSILAAAWSPDGRRIVTTSDDGTARIWRSDGKGRPVVLKGAGTELFVVAAWSPDGEHVVVGSDEAIARVWEADGRGAPVVLKGHTDAILSAAWSPDSGAILTVSDDETARVWDPEAGEAMVVLQGHTDAIVSAAWSPDGERVITTSDDKTARVWEAYEVAEPLVLTGHPGPVASAVWSPDGRHVLTRSKETVRLWQLRVEPVVLAGHRGSVMSAAWSPDGGHILTTAFDSPRIWNADGSGAPVVLKGGEERLTSAVWSSDGQHILTVARDNRVRAWRGDGSSVSVGLTGDETWIRAPRWSADGQYILTVSVDATARVWRVDGSGDPVVLTGQEGWDSLPTWSPDGHGIVASAGNTAYAWQAEGTSAPVVRMEHPGVVESAEWSPDGQNILTRSEDGTVRVWKADGAGAPVVLGGREVRFVEWSPDSQRILTVPRVGTGQVWRADGTGAPLVLAGQGASLRGAEFSPDSRRIAAAFADGKVRVWMADAAGAPVVFASDQGRSPKWSPDSQRLVVTKLSGGQAWVWRADGTGEPVVLAGHEDGVLSAEWSPDSQHILTVSGSKAARVWRADGAGGPGVLRGFRGESLSSPEWSPDGQRILVTSRDSAVVLAATVPALRQALQRATSACLTAEMRVTYLDESEADARDRYDACERSHDRIPFYPTSTESSVSFDAPEDDSPTAPEEPGPRVRLFERANFTGRSASFGPGEHDLPMSRGIDDDAVSSVRVPAGLRVTLRDRSERMERMERMLRMSRDSDEGVPDRSREPGAATPGRSLVLTADAATLGDFDDLCSSILVEIDPTVEPAAVVTPEGVDTWAFESSE